jgi:hypothetical protein
MNSHTKMLWLHDQLREYLLTVVFVDRGIWYVQESLDGSRLKACYIIPYILSMKSILELSYQPRETLIDRKMEDLNLNDGLPCSCPNDREENI